MIETIIGLVFGNLSRLGIEFFKQKKEAKKFEYESELFTKQIELEKLKLTGTVSTNETDKYIATYGALSEATKAQAVVTGTWVDAVSSSVRPIVTYVFLVLYAAGKIVYSINTGHLSWTKEDDTIFASIISFWFADRAIRK